MANLQVGVAGNGTVTVGAGASVHSPASNTLTLGTNGDERVRIDSSGTAKFSGNIEVDSGSNGMIDFGDITSGYGRLYADSTGTFIGSKSNDPLILRTNHTEVARLDTSGRLLLGTTTEGHTSADDLTIATSGATGITIRSGTSNAGNIYFSDATSGTAEYAGYVSYSHSTNSLSFGTNDGSERLLITSDGSMGLGTTPETDGQANSLYFANGNANIWGSGNVNFYTVVNARYTGTSWKYNNTATASYTGQQSGVWSFHNAPSGTADAAATFTERIRIGTSGEIGIAGANYGTSGQVLTSGGSGSAVSWATAGGITQADFWRLSSSLQANQLPIASNLERVDTYGFGTGSLLGSGMTESSGVFTFPATGLYWVHAFGNVYSANHSQTNTLQIRYTADGGSNWATASVGAQGIYDQGSDSYGNIGTNALIDVTSTSNVKVAFNFGAGQGGEYLEGHTTYTYTGFIFIRLAAT
jgi:hypothetical protein